MCERYTFQLSAYVDDEISASERAEIEAHLAACDDCRTTVRSLRETGTLAALLPEVLPPPNLRAQILARTVHRPGFWERVRARVGQPSVWRPATAGAGALAVLLGMLYGGMHVPSAGRHGAVRNARVGHAARHQVARRWSHAVSKEAVARVDEIPATRSAGGVGGWIDSLKATWKPLAQETHARRSKLRRAAPSLIGRDAVAAVERARTGRVVTAAAALAAKGASHRTGAVAAALRPKHGKAVDAAHARHTAPAVRGRSDVPVPPLAAAPDRLASAPPMAPSAPPMGTPAAPVTTPAAAPAAAPAVAPAAARPSNPIADEFARLAQRPTQERQMAQVVEDLNAAAFSHREVEWKFARLKF